VRLSKTKLKRIIKEEMRIAIALHENADLMQNATLLNIRDFGYIPEDPNFDQKAEAEPAFGDIKRHLEADEGAIAIAKSGSKYVFIMLGLSEPHGPNEVRSVGHVDSRYTSGEKALQMFKDHAEKFVDDEVAKNAVMNTTLEDLDNLQNEDMLVVKSKKKVSDTLSWLQSLSAQPVEKSSSKSEDRYHDEPYHHQPGLVGGAARHRKRVSKYYKESKLTKSNIKDLIKEELRSVMIEEGLWDSIKKGAKIAYNAPGRLANKAANKIYDMTASKDVPTMATGPADKVSKMQQPWEYKEATQDEKTKFDVAMAIAGLLSLGLGAAAAGGGAAKKAAGQTALKQYLTDKAIDAPAIAASTYASYQLAMQKAGKKPVGKQRFDAAKAALKNIAIEAMPGNKAIGIGAKASATAAG